MQTALQFVATLVIPSVVYRRQVAIKLWCFQFSVLEIPVLRSSLASNPSHFSFAFCASIRVQVSVEKSVVKCADFLNLCFVLLGFCFCLHTETLKCTPSTIWRGARLLKSGVTGWLTTVEEGSESSPFSTTVSTVQGYRQRLKAKNRRIEESACFPTWF